MQRKKEKNFVAGQSNFDIMYPVWKSVSTKSNLESYI